MATQTVKAKRTEAPKRPSLARTEIVDKAIRQRFEQELDGALKRKPAGDVEIKLAGALRAVATLSPALRGTLADATQVMVRRGSFARELYGVAVRTLAEADDRRVPALLATALAAEDAGGHGTLSAASLCKDPALASPLAKLAASRNAHIAFAAETARVCRRESNGAHLAHVAPMIKESHRITLCGELFVPLARALPVPASIGPALDVLRGAERHLGRWLVLAEVTTKAGDPSALTEATSKAQEGPSSARTAWLLVAWALEQARGRVFGGPASALPTARPTVELVARLSDRPSADRDTTFLFRMARAGATSCKPMLDAIAKPGALTDEVAMRAASFLVRDHAPAERRAELVDALVDAAVGGREELRGLASAALWDTGDDRAREVARARCDELAASRVLANVAWSALIRAASVKDGATNAPASLHAERDVVVSEAALRWIQWGWLE